jgi:RimJ/RimL family protein N-acetyltransferase
MVLAIPRLGDGVIALRPPSPDDVDALYDACQDSQIARFTSIPCPYRREHAVKFVDDVTRGWRDGVNIAFVVVDAESGELLGTTGLARLERQDDVAEVGYWVKREARGRGVAPRAVRLVANWVLRDLGVGRLELQADVRNTASQRVAEKVGFRREGQVPPPPRCAGLSETMVLFSITASEL